MNVPRRKKQTKNGSSDKGQALARAEQDLLEALFGPEEGPPDVFHLRRTEIGPSPLEAGESGPALPRAPGAPRPASQPRQVGNLRCAGIRRRSAQQRERALPPAVKRLLIARSRLVGWMQNRKGRLVGLGCVLLLGLFKHIGLEGCVPISARDRSLGLHAPGQLGAGGEARSYGLGKVDVRCEWRAAFGFPYAHGKVTVQYAVGGIQGKRDLAIELNGVLVDHAPMTLDRWSAPLTLELPRAHLNQDGPNEIAFVHLANKARHSGQARWGVRVASIQETPLPAPDLSRAEAALKLARGLHRNLDVAPANLYGAWERFGEARDLLELIPGREELPLYQEAAEMEHKLRAALEKRFRTLQFSAEQALTYRKAKQAAECYRQMLASFPSTDDPRHRTANELLSSLRSRTNQEREP